jgi:hypothetical protein
MGKAEKLQTQIIGPSDLRKRASILRAYAGHFDLIANMMDNGNIPPLEMKGTATYERAVGYLKGGVSTATQAVMDFVLENGIVLDVADPSGTAQKVLEIQPLPKKPKR